jgi:1,4-dihydroxy-2-naphthoyl-CoA hydrolase
MAMDVASLQAQMAPLFPGTLGLTLREASGERVVADLEVRPELCTLGGVLHGGALMGLADTLGAIGTLLHLPQGGRTTTIESSTKFLAAGKVGTTVTGECRALHRGRTTMVWQTFVRDPGGKLLGVVTQTQLVL